MHIRLEIPADIPAIHALTQAAFLDAPHTQHTEHFIVDALRAAGQLSLSLVAYDDAHHDAHDITHHDAQSHGSIVGHIAFSPVHLMHGEKSDVHDDAIPSGWFGLGPVSVLPSRQRQGIGSMLITHALATLKQARAAGCVVLGDPAYYSRFGFAAQPSLTLPDVPPEYFMAIVLDSQLSQLHLSQPLRGTVRYHQAFDTRGPA